MSEDPAAEALGNPSLVTICALGASAGGVTALRKFFSRIRTDLNLAYVVVVHLSPDHPSALSEILGSCTSMSVNQVEDGPSLEPNCVYVIPPDRELVITGNAIAARPFTQPRGRRAPIDMLFRSIAAARGDGCAVIMSGSGADGSLGVRAIKEDGGVVLVQEPADAEYPMMPQNAIATGAADFIGSIGELVERLTEIAHSKESIRSLSIDGEGNEVRRILHFMRARTGHDFSNYKRATVVRQELRDVVLPPFPDLSMTLATEPRRHLSRDEGDRSATFLHMQALERHSPPSVLVDDAQRIVNLSPSAGRFIQHSGGPFTAELPAIVRPELRLDLKIAIEHALTLRRPTLTLPNIVEFDNVRRRVSMHVSPVSDESSAAQVLVMFLDGGDIDDSEAQAGADVGTKPAEARRLYEELKIAHEHLDASRREHDIATQDLRAANEELQSVNEEYRSTAEELETSKEELQSINEELQTVNAELKSKLESISSAHNDLQNLTTATEIGTLFLDPQLRIRMFTPPVAELFNICEADIGRPITNFTHHLRYRDIEQDSRRVLRHLSPFETVVESTSDKSFMVRIRPYRTLEDRIEGLVITFVDVSARLETDRQLRESEARYRRLFNSIDEAFCIIEVVFDEQQRPCDIRYVEVNAAFERQTGLQNVEGKTIRSLVPDLDAYWYEIFGRVASTGRPERFEGYAASLGRHFEGFAFALPEERRIGTLFMDVSSRKQFEAHLKLMVDELNHRVKNTLAVVQAIAQQTFKEDVVTADAKRAFLGRLTSLAVAHNLLTRSHWEKASLAEVLRAVVTGCRSNPEQFAIDGPAVVLSSAQAVSLSMATHELCINAIKYGALSQPQGRVEVGWKLSGDKAQPRVRLTWRERGGPAVVPPTRHGFGLMMIEKALAYELGGTAGVDFQPGGIVCTIEAALVSQLQPQS